MKALDIADQLDAQLISRHEARDALHQLVKRAEFDRDYSDHIDSYRRFDGEARDARAVLKRERLAS